jgi:twitching motility two-component system response regulator PilG
MAVLENIKESVMTRPASDAIAQPLRRVVIADGDADTRMMYREALRSLPLDIVETEDGRDALVQCLIEPPALLVADTYLTTIDGYQLCQLLRRDRATRSVPILIVTSEARPVELTRLRQLGATRIVPKPLALDGFCEAVLGLSESAAPEAIDVPINDSGKAASKAFRRFETMAPPRVPPVLHCPECDRVMDYQKSRVGGVSQSNPEQWDQFGCAGCAAVFEYRHRTRRLRQAFI